MFINAKGKGQRAKCKEPKASSQISSVVSETFVCAGHILTLTGGSPERAVMTGIL